MSEPTRMQLEARQEVIEYQGRGKFMLSLKCQAQAEADWCPSKAQAQAVIKMRGEQATSRLVSHQPRRRETMYPSFRRNDAVG